MLTTDWLNQKHLAAETILRQFAIYHQISSVDLHNYGIKFCFKTWENQVMRGTFASKSIYLHGRRDALVGASHFSDPGAYTGEK